MHRRALLAAAGASLVAPAVSAAPDPWTAFLEALGPVPGMSEAVAHARRAGFAPDDVWTVSRGPHPALWFTDPSAEVTIYVTTEGARRSQQF